MSKAISRSKTSWSPLTSALGFIFRHARILLISLVLVALTGLLTWVGYLATIHLANGLTGHFFQQAPGAEGISGWFLIKGWWLLKILFLIVRRREEFSVLKAPMEGQPISILEAMATGNIILTTNHAGIPDIFEMSVSLFNILLKGAIIFPRRSSLCAPRWPLRNLFICSIKYHFSMPAIMGAPCLVLPSASFPWHSAQCP